jgi:hypothetical protein
MRFLDSAPAAGGAYRVIAVNSVGLRSAPSGAVSVGNQGN